MYQHIRDIREDSDVTQRQIAAYLNVTQATYSRYENGRLDIPTDTLVLLAKFYNTSIDYLLDQTDEVKPYPRRRRRT